jgi:hypothetical protein
MYYSNFICHPHNNGDLNPMDKLEDPKKNPKKIAINTNKELAKAEKPIEKNHIK